MHKQPVKKKSGINQPIICSNCGKRVGIVTVRQKAKWRTIRWAIGLGLAFEIVANIVVYLIFK